MIETASERPLAQLLRGGTFGLVGLVEIEAISRCLARRKRTNHGHKGGENVFHWLDGSKFIPECQRGSPGFAQDGYSWAVARA